MALFSPRRALGRTGFVATRLGIGDVADRAVPLADCAATVVRALDHGLNLVDTAPNYEDGYSEQVLAMALRARRDNVFVVDKIDHFDQPVAAQLDGSLARLQMDHVDLLAFHACSTLGDLDRLCARGGGFDQIEREQRRGRTRWRGISSHHPEVLAAAIERGVCDVALFPLGPFTDRRYEQEILPLARRHGVGQVCFKTFGAGKLLGDTEGYQRPLLRQPPGKVPADADPAAARSLPRLSVEECVRYTLTLDPDVALLGLSFADEQDAAFAAAAAFMPFSAVEMALVRQRAALAVQGKGPCWWNPDPMAAVGDGTRAGGDDPRPGDGTT